MGSDSKRRWLKWLVTVVLLATAAGGGLWYYQHQQDEAAEYQTAKVTRGDLIQVVTATGQLGPVLNVQVGSQISGRIQKLYVDYNSVVKSNQVIAEIEPVTEQPRFLAYGTATDRASVEWKYVGIDDIDAPEPG